MLKGGAYGKKEEGQEEKEEISLRMWGGGELNPP
jgi:hypothetical protein